MAPRTSLKERKLPKYTFGEEMFNMISHIAGGIFAIVALCTCLCVAVVWGDGWGIVSAAIYGGTMIMLYSMSSVYHGLTAIAPKKVFQVIDHCSVFLLIAGTYTPFTLVCMRPKYPVHAWVIFGIVWGFTILGIVFNSIDLRKYRVFSMICYIGTGWSIVFVSNALLGSMPVAGYVLLMLGGVCYTVGAVLYGVGKKKKYMHSIFHLLVLGGSIFHYICIMLYVLPINK